jgi:RTX calcium-binding nonapeptide repeat (4 copies)
MATVEGTNNSEIINLLDGVTNGGDTIYGRSGTIFGLGGDDYILGSSGADDIDGGNGADRLGLWDSTEGVSVSLLSGIGLGGEAQGVLWERLFA